MAPKWVNEEPELTTPMSFHKRFDEKLAVFVPPFIRQANPDDQKGETAVVHCTKAQSVFVPPFKTCYSTAEAAGHTEMHAKSCQSQTPLCRAGNDLSHIVKLDLGHKTSNTDVPTEDYKSSSPSGNLTHTKTYTI